VGAGSCSGSGRARRCCCSCWRREVARARCCASSAHPHDSRPISARSRHVPYFWPHTRPRSTSPHIHRHRPRIRRRQRIELERASAVLIGTLDSREDFSTWRKYVPAHISHDTYNEHRGHFMSILPQLSSITAYTYTHISLNYMLSSRLTTFRKPPKPSPLPTPPASTKPSTSPSPSTPSSGFSAPSSSAPSRAAPSSSTPYYPPHNSSSNSSSSANPAPSTSPTGPSNAPAKTSKPKA
jgi:hypothetical protein